MTPDTLKSFDKQMLAEELSGTAYKVVTKRKKDDKSIQRVELRKNSGHTWAGKDYWKLLASVTVERYIDNRWTVNVVSEDAKHIPRIVTFLAETYTQLSITGNP